MQGEEHVTVPVPGNERAENPFIGLLDKLSEKKMKGLEQGESVWEPQ